MNNISIRTSDLINCRASAIVFATATANDHDVLSIESPALACARQLVDAAAHGAPKQNLLSAVRSQPQSSAKAKVLDTLPTPSKAARKKQRSNEKSGPSSFTKPELPPLPGEQGGVPCPNEGCNENRYRSYYQACKNAWRGCKFSPKAPIICPWMEATGCKATFQTAKQRGSHTTKHIYDTRTPYPCRYDCGRR